MHEHETNKLKEADEKQCKEANLRRTERTEKEKAIEDAHQQHQETWEWTIEFLATDPQKEDLEKIYKRRLNRVIETYYYNIIAKPISGFTQMSLESEMSLYKQGIEIEKTAKDKGKPNLEEATCSTPRSRERSSTPRREPINKSAILRRIRSTSPDPEIIDIDIMSSPSRPEEETASGEEQEPEEETTEESAQTETEEEPPQHSQNASQSKRPRSPDENSQQNNSCRNCACTNHLN